MKYVTVYENLDSGTLNLALENLKDDGIISAQINPTNKTILEVSVEDKEKAEVFIQEMLKVWREMEEDSDAPHIKYTVTNKIDLLKIFAATLFFGFGWILNIFTGNAIAKSDFLYKTPLLWLTIILFFGSLLSIQALASKLGMINLPFPLNIEDEKTLIKIQKRLKLLKISFWILSIIAFFVFWSSGKIDMNAIISSTSIKTILNSELWLGPWICLGAYFWILNILANFRIYFNPKEYTVEEIEECKIQKEKIIVEAKRELN